jgi:serine/threonine kinase 16
VRGFSYVYLVTDSSGALYALKKIRCPFGQESVRNALKEVEAYNLFNHKSIIKCIVTIPKLFFHSFYFIRLGAHEEDHATIQERDGTKTVYILLPYFRRGNLQDAINANLVNHTSFPEIDLLKLFRGVCVAVEQLHEYRLVAVPTRRNDAPTMEEEPLMDEGVAESEEEVGELVPYAHRDIKPGTPSAPKVSRIIRY